VRARGRTLLRGEAFWHGGDRNEERRSGGSRLETVNGWRMYALEGYRETGNGLKRRR
jgi:hypothetical protein